MKIAVTSSNGKTVDTHFGHADTFYIFELRNGSISFIEKRNSIKYSPGENSLHIFSENRFEKVYEVIKDCRMLYTTQIGNIPAGMLRAKGIYPEIIDGNLSSEFLIAS